MPYVPNQPYLDGSYRNPGPQRIESAWGRRFLATLMNRDSLQKATTTSNSSSTTTAPLFPVQRFPHSASATLPPDLAAGRIGTTKSITARNSAAARNSFLNGAT